MVLQLLSMGIVPLTYQVQALQNYQALQLYNYKPLNQTLDPITAQIIKTQDSALEVMKLIENGTVSQFLENEKKTVRSYTWIGSLMDKLFGWGEYHPEFKKETLIKNVTTKRNLLEWDCDYIRITQGYITTSFEVQKFLNNSCNRFNMTQYYSRLYQFPVLDNDRICRVNNCIKDHLMACYPNCLPCQNATDEEKTTFLNETIGFHIWHSKIDDLQHWACEFYDNISNPTEINAWISLQFINLYNSTINACEEQELNYKSPNYAYLSLLSIPVVAGSAIFAAYRIKKAQQSHGYEPIPNA